MLTAKLTVQIHSAVTCQQHEPLEEEVQGVHDDRGLHDRRGGCVRGHRDLRVAG